MSTSAVDESAVPAQGPPKLPPVLGRLLGGSFWLALRSPLQAVFSLWTIPLILQAVDSDAMGAYGFAWGFGFFQFLLEFGMSSALQRQVSETWTRGDRDGVNRAIACGMTFYALMAVVQVAALLAVAYVAVPYSKYPAGSYSYDLIIRLLWLQAVTAPCYGLSMVVSSVLQAARRYEIVPRLDLLVITMRFAVLYVGVQAGVDFFLVVVTQSAVSITIALLPTLWVMTRHLGFVPHFRGATLADFKALAHVSFYMFLLQLSVVLADKIDTTILGFALDDPGPATAVYQVVSKPFLQIRQTGWTLAYFVMPAVASLLAARDLRALDRVKYDGTRLHLGLILPVTLLAFAYAEPFLTLWVGDKLGYDAGREAPLLRLFLVATLPLALSVPVQVAFGMSRVKVVAVAALGGALVNLPLSYALTLRLGVSGVIWGTVLTTVFSNLLIPGVYLFRVLEFRPRMFLTRTLSAPAAGAAALLVAVAALWSAYPLHPSPRGGMSLGRWLPLIGHLGVACLAYAAGYLAAPAGRGDLFEIIGKLRRRASA